jgi:hypothetical protein
MRFRGVRGAEGAPYWRTRERVFRFLSALVGFTVLVDLLGRLSGEAIPKWSTPIGAAVVWLILARAQRSAHRKASELKPR